MCYLLYPLRHPPFCRESAGTFYPSGVLTAEHALWNDTLKIRYDRAKRHQCSPAYDDPFQPCPGLIHRPA